MAKRKPKKSIAYKMKKGTIYHDRRYKRWRTRVFRRDRWTCQECHKKGSYLEVHHIFPKGKFPKLIFVVGNGITLCKPCHRAVTGNELSFTQHFKDLIEKQRVEKESKRETWKIIKKHS